MRRWASRMATRRISFTDQGIKLRPDGPVSFLGWQAVRAMAHHGHHGKGEHDQRDGAVPPMPGPRLVVGQPELRFGRLERVLDGPTPALNRHQRADRRAGRAPGREEREFSIGEAAADQQAARPQPGPGGAIVARLGVGQLAVGPVVEPLALRALACLQALPGRLRQTAGDRFGRAGDFGLADPRG